MEAILISYPEYFKNEILTVCKLLEQYNFVYHLRKPHFSGNDYDKYLGSIPSDFHPGIVIHGAFHLSDKYNIRGFHLSAKNREIELPDTLTGTKSTSCHSIDEMHEMDGDWDYFFLSPIFPSISKPGYFTGLDLDEINSYLEHKKKTSVFALGGITAEKIHLLEKLGFDGFALLGTIWGDDPENSSQILNNFKQIDLCMNHGHTV